MQTSYFQGRDGFIWWNGVVEDRKDPLYLGRCKVRILGWHTENKSELPTANLPWAQVLMPVTSASQTNVGHAPVGPVEGTWVMGFYRDGELAQEPVMMGTIPGIPENYAEQYTGFNDPRADIVAGDIYRLEGPEAMLGSPTTGIGGFPFPPKSIVLEPGAAEANVIDYDNDQKLNLDSKSLYPRETNVPTTSRYARGRGDATSKLTGSILTSKTSSRGIYNVEIRSFTPDSSFSLLQLDRGFIPDSDFSALIQSSVVTKKITQPDSAYDAQYPFNHVYESESGHLIEQDDTPNKERLHWYHRSGTFTEFHPAGIRVDKTQGSRFNIVSGNYKSIISGEEVKHVGGDYTLDLGGKLSLISEAGVRIYSKDNIIVESDQNTYIGGKNIILNAKENLILRGGAAIFREDDEAVDKVAGDFKLSVGGGYTLAAGKVSVGSSIGALNLTSGGSMQSVVAGNSEETISNKDILFGNIFAKKITALNGMIGIESTQLIPLTGGIDLNVGLLGAFGTVKILPTGDITILSTLGAAGVVTSAPIGNITQLAGLVATLIGSTGTVIGSPSSVTSIEGLPAVGIHLGGTSEPAVLGKKFLELFTKHTHPSSVGPTGVPLNAAETVSVFSKKVFLG